MSTSNSASFFQAVMESRPPIAHDAAFFNKHLVNFDSRRTRERLQSVCGKRLYANFHAEEQLHSTSDATPTAKVQLLQSITNDQVKYPTSSDCTVQKIRSLQKCNNKLRREVESLKATLASQSASLSALESRCVEYASGWKSTYSLWEEIYSGAFAEDCKYGYSLTDKQLNGARNELSMLWDARRGRYVRRSIPNTTCELFPKGLLVPKIPNAKTLRNEVSVYADDLGFRDCVDGRGALISASKAVVFALAEAGSLVTGARQVQIIGDGHEALRTYGLVNVCARGIHSGAFFNALATMNRW